MPVIHEVTVEPAEKESRFRITWHKVGAGISGSFTGELEVSPQIIWHQLDIGMKLFRFLDGDTHYFQQALQEAEQQGETLQLHLYACKEISDWPFELLAKENIFLLPYRLHLIRKVSDWGKEKQVLPGNRPLKLLFMACSALDVQPELDFEKEEEAIFRITENLAIEIEIENSGSLEGLRHRLERNMYDVVHLSGYAGIDQKGIPYFIMEDETGYNQKVYPPRLWQEALIENPPRLLLLTGSVPGKPGNPGGSQLKSFGLKMVESYGVPTVLVLDRPIKDVQTMYAAQIFYLELSRGKSILEAVQRVRYELIEHFPGNAQSAWPLLRLFSGGVALNAIVKKGQHLQPKPRQMKFVSLKSSRIQVLVEGFIGRRRQMQRILHSLKQDYDKVGVLLLGTGGLGKSCLAGKITERFPQHTLIIVHEKFNTFSLESALKDAFIQAQDKKGQRILSRKGQLMDKLADLCAKSFKEKNYLLLLDGFDQNIEDAEKGQPGSLLPEATELLKTLLYYLPYSGKMTQIIITSRYPFSITEQGRDQVRDRLESVWLTGLNESEQHDKVRELKNIFNYPDRSLVLKLAAAGHGNPRLMEWLDVLVGQMTTADAAELLEAIKDKKEEFIRSHVLQELLQRGGEKLEEFLRYLSIYRRALSRIGVQQVAKNAGIKNWKELLERAINLSLVEFDQALRRYRVIPLLHDLLLRGLEDSRSLHMAAFDYYKKQCENREPLEPILWEEWIFHALNCGEKNIAFQQGGRLVKHLREQLAFQESLRIGEWILTGQKRKLSNIDYAYFLNELASTYYDFGYYRQAIKYYKQALVIWKEIYGEKHPGVADSLKNIGSSWEAIRDYSQAIEYYEKALAALEEIHGKRHLYVADVLNKLGVSWNALGENRKAIEYFEQALLIWKEIHGNKHPQVAAGLNNLGLAMNALGDSKKAIEQYEQALTIDKSVHGEKHPDIAIDLNNLGSAWSTLGEHRKAIEYYERALTIDADVFGPEHPNVARELNNLGSAWYDLGDFGKALDYFKQAMAIEMAVWGKNHPSIAKKLTNIGSAWYDLGDFRKAIEYFEQALAIDQTVFGDKHPAVATDLTNLGESWRALGEPKKAIQFCEQALSIQKKIYEDKHSQIANTLNIMGLAWSSLGDKPKAISYYEQTLSIWQAVYGGTHHKVAIALNNLGGAWSGLGNYRKAISYFEQALEIIESVFGKDHPNVAIQLNNLGDTWRVLGNPKRAIGYFDQALAIWMAIYGESHPNVATTLSNLGGAWFDLGEFDKSISCHERSLAINKHVFKNDHASVATELNNLGLAWFALGDYRKSLSYHEQALAIDEQVFGNEHPNVSRDLNNLGEAWRELGQHKKAINYYEQAMVILNVVYRDSHPDIASILNNLGRAWEDLGETKKAISYHEQALAINERVFGKEHPSVARDLICLGAAYFSLGNNRKAKPYFQNAYDIYKKFFGELHPHTQNAKDWLDDC